MKRRAGDISEDSLEWLNPSPVKSPRLTITTTTITSREEEEQVGVVTINHQYRDNENPDFFPGSGSRRAQAGNKSQILIKKDGRLFTESGGR